MIAKMCFRKEKAFLLFQKKPIRMSSNSKCWSCNWCDVVCGRASKEVGVMIAVIKAVCASNNNNSNKSSSKRAREKCQHKKENNKKGVIKWFVTHLVYDIPRHSLTFQNHTSSSSSSTIITVHFLLLI